MEASFWHNKWAKDEIGFHEGKPNRFLVRHFSALDLAPWNVVFVPLCGKTQDIPWLLSQGYCVKGVELNETAIQALFADLNLKPEVTINGTLKHYRANRLDIYVGDVFEVTGEILGPVDAIYDRAALVALPSDMRARYSKHLVEITKMAPQLLICFDYDQAELTGPPFSIPATLVRSLYGGNYYVSLLEGLAIEGGLKGQCAAIENAWLLIPQ